jgi:hypothetical protein
MGKWTAQEKEKLKWNIKHKNIKHESEKHFAQNDINYTQNTS